MAPHVQSVFVELERRRDSETLSFQYMCRSGDSAPPLALFQKAISLPEAKRATDQLSQVLANRTLSASADLRSCGGKLFDKFVPNELSERLAQEPDGSYLVLYLAPELTWIPWELLWDGARFLCERFRIARVLQKAGEEFRAAERRLREARSGRGALIIFGNTQGLDATAEKIEVDQALKTMYGPKNVWFFGATSASDVLEQLKQDYEICHFVGHGSYNEVSPGETGWVFRDGTVLKCRDIEAVSSRAAFPLLIFANSCDSAHPSLADTAAYISTLYRSFLRQGVPHYIGTVTPIPDESSKEFARSFYRFLAEGSSIGEALGETRQAFAGRPGMPIWAAYVHYGDPTHRLLQPASAQTISGGYRRSPEVLRDKTTFYVLGRLSREELQRTLDHYRNAVTTNSVDGEAHYGLALCYLQLQLYDLAIKNFKRALELMPEHADAYYYYAVSLIRGRRPKLLSLPEVKRIEEYLQTALQLDGRPAKYYYLAAILKYDYYLSNGLLCNPSPDELFLAAEDQEHDAWEVERLMHAVPLRDPELIARVRRKHETLKI